MDALNETDFIEKFKKHADRLKAFSLWEFLKESKRSCLIQTKHIVYEATNQFMDDESLACFLDFLSYREFQKKRAALFLGECVNISENRPALHTALRDQDETPIFISDENIALLVKNEKAHFLKFAEQLRAGSVNGSTGQPIRDVVHIGIGGSDLGPRMASKALSHLKCADLNVHYVANSDIADLLGVLEKCKPEQTVVIISSKSFTTQETMLNAKFAIHWLQESLQGKFFSHLYAVTAHPDRAQALGVPASHIFLLWDWVGGRFSMWSAIGLPLAIQIGAQAFESFLQGAYEADQHFLKAPLSDNIPVLMAILDFWYTNFWGTQTKAVLPYAEKLALFPDYLQQLQMESNGKSVTQSGKPLPFTSSMVLWGKSGSHGQHAFHQLFFQGTHFIPVDIILPATISAESKLHRKLTLANALSQAQALMRGKKDELAFKTVRGGQPSQIFLLKALSPECLGMLCAFYEHKVFVESVLLDINPFDQWGVELGKTLSLSLQNMLETGLCEDTEGATKHLIEAIQLWQTDE